MASSTSAAQFTFADFLARHVQKVAQEQLAEPATRPLPLMNINRLLGVRDMVREAEKLLSSTYGKLLTADHLANLSGFMRRLEKENLDRTTKLAVKLSFDYEYIDCTSVDALRSHITTCWKAYSMDSATNPPPLITLMQSAGFGKSRLLYELAKRVSKEDNDAISMRLLYVRPDNATDATAYPRMHPQICEFLFPPALRRDAKGFGSWVAQRLVDEMASRLVAIFMLANTSDTTWSSIGEQWLSLFTSEDADVKLVEQLKLASEVDAEDPTSCGAPANTSRLLVLAIDQADWLRPRPEGSYVDWYWTFSRALVTANQRLRQRLGGAGSCGIFAVLVTVYPPPVKCLSALAIERRDDVAISTSNRSTAVCVRHAVPFAPFILTDTMDVFHKQTFLEWLREQQTLPSSDTWSRFHQETVLDQDRDAKFSMETLISMGRPLWTACTLPSWMTTQNRVVDEFCRVVNAAKHKLLGCDAMPATPKLTEQCMRVVASVLCRTTVQINSSSTVASRLVARHMAVLTTRSTNQTRYQNGLTHCSYPSDPMLAFGAAEVWYEGTKHSPNWLTSSILPALHDLISNRTLLVENMGILVAELVLLVTIDQCVASCVKLHHQFIDLAKFMSYLPPAVGSSGDEAMKKWRGWKLGFNHFVQLERMPTEGCLWAMVSRRAAGAFTHTQRGMDLFIPIFIGGRSPRVSMIIIQVHSGVTDDGTYASGDGLPTLRPCQLFESAPYIESLGADKVLRFVMRLDSRDEDTSRTYQGDVSTGYWQMNCAGPWKRVTKQRRTKDTVVEEVVIAEGIAHEFIDLLRLDEMPSRATSHAETLKYHDARAHTEPVQHLSSLLFGDFDKTLSEGEDSTSSTRKSKARAAPPLDGAAQRKSPRLS